MEEDQLSVHQVQGLIDNVRYFWCKVYKRNFLCDLGELPHTASDDQILEAIKKLL